jgi:hypothetical protein
MARFLCGSLRFFLVLDILRCFNLKINKDDIKRKCKTDGMFSKVTPEYFVFSRVYPVKKHPGVSKEFGT